MSQLSCFFWALILITSFNIGYLLPIVSSHIYVPIYMYLTL